MKKLVKSVLISMLRVHAKYLSWIGAKTYQSQYVSKILICNAGHLGDMVMLRTTIPYIRRNFPDAEIGVLIGSWNHHLFDRHPDISHIHHIDQFRHNRSKTSWINKVIIERNTRKKAVHEIAQIGYDVAVDTYHFMFNNTRHIWYAGIPRRIGFNTSGYESILTDVVEYKNSDKHEVDVYMDVLRQLSGEWPDKVTEYCGLSDICVPYTLNEPYVVFHYGAGDTRRLWDEKAWAELCNLMDHRVRIVFTGYGADEDVAISRIISLTTNKRVMNLSSRLSFGEYIGLVGKAEILVGVESLSGHVAAACHIPSISIYSGLTNYHQWRPLGDRAIVILGNDPICAHSNMHDEKLGVFPQRVYQYVQSIMAVPK